MYINQKAFPINCEKQIIFLKGFQTTVVLPFINAELC